MYAPLSQEFPDFDTQKAVVLLLGSVSHEGITSSLRAGGEQYKQKFLASSIDNWKSIVRIFREFRIRAVVMKLNGDAYARLASPEYAEVGRTLLSAVAETRHIAFAHENLLGGYNDTANVGEENRGWRVEDFDDLDDPETAFPQYPPFPSLSLKVLDTSNALVRELNISLRPYRRNAEVTVMSIQFLQDVLDNLLFRVYVPTGRLWADEVDRLLQLFRDYLLRAGHKGVRLDQSRTDRGVSYEFHATEEQQQFAISE